MVPQLGVPPRAIGRQELYQMGYHKECDQTSCTAPIALGMTACTACKGTQNQSDAEIDAELRFANIREVMKAGLQIIQVWIKGYEKQDQPRPINLDDLKLRTGEFDIVLVRRFREEALREIDPKTAQYFDITIPSAPKGGCIGGP